MVGARLGALAGACVGVLGCVDAPAGAPTLTLTVAPLTLTGVTAARYALEVSNRDGAVVMQRTLDSRTHGAGDGSLSYVGPCDASANDNVLTLTLLDLYEGTSPEALVDPATYRNPGPLARAFTCLEGADVAVSVDLAIARAAQQGFFDVAVTFDNIFCSAKLDCLDDHDQPLALLFDASGVRARTAVLALACTGGLDGSDTTLYHDDVVVTCTGGGAGGAGGTATVDVSAGPGNLSAGHGVTDPQGLLFGAAVYRGAEQLGYAKRYWNVLLGLTSSAAHCAVVSRATAARGAFTANTTPADTTYPFVLWDRPLTGADGALACGHHPLGGAGVHAGVSIAYTPLDAPRPFARAYPEAPAPAPTPLATALTCAGGTVHDTRGCRWEAPGQATFAVPAGVSTLHAKLWGAGGGDATGSYDGGGGGYVGGDVAVTPGETVVVEISAVQASSYGTNAGKGGPRAALWRTSATAELLVAGGGGGSGNRCFGGPGGGGAAFTLPAGSGHAGADGAGPCIYASGSAPPGGGGTGVAGGLGGALGSPRTHPTVLYYAGADGARILGGPYRGSGFQGANGGDGYYGGGAGGPADYVVASGGGGSSFAAAVGVSNAVFEGGSGYTPGHASDPDRGNGGTPSWGSPEPGLARIVLRWD